MSEWQRTLERRAMFERARALLQRLGHPYVHSVTTVRKLIIQTIGHGSLPDDQLIFMFEQRVNEDKAPAQRLTIARPYVPDMAMRQAAARAQVQPSMIGVNSKKEISR